MSNTDCALPTKEDDQFLEEIQKSRAGKEKEPPYIGKHSSSILILSMERKRNSACCFHGYIPVGMAILMRVERSILVSRIRLDSSCSFLMAGFRRIIHGVYMPCIMMGLEVT
jgi:hypothetical protein